MIAAETYAARIDAVRAQRARLHGALPGVPPVPGGPMSAQMPQTPDDAVQLALQGQWLGPHDHARARRLIEERFGELASGGARGADHLGDGPEARIG
jgi:hypothetical protein